MFSGFLQEVFSNSSIAVVSQLISFETPYISLCPRTLLCSLQEREVFEGPQVSIQILKSSQEEEGRF